MQLEGIDNNLIIFWSEFSYLDATFSGSWFIVHCSLFMGELGRGVLLMVTRC